jgi:hypothetical protein
MDYMKRDRKMLTNIHVSEESQKPTFIIEISVKNSSMSACCVETTDWWCIQATRRPSSQIESYGFIQKGRISVLIDEKEKTYRLDSKGK